MSIFKYDEIYIKDIEKVCNDILRVAFAIKEGKEMRKPMLVKDFKPEKIVIGNSEYTPTCKEALGFLDGSIHIDEYTLSLLILNLHAIEEKRRIESTLAVEKDCGVVFKTDDKPTGIIEYKD